MSPKYVPDKRKDVHVRHVSDANVYTYMFRPMQGKIVMSKKSKGENYLSMFKFKYLIIFYHL